MKYSILLGLLSAALSYGAAYLHSINHWAASPMALQGAIIGIWSIWLYGCRVLEGK